MYYNITQRLMNVGGGGAPFREVMHVTLFERLSLLIAAITLVGTACLIMEMRRF